MDRAKRISIPKAGSASVLRLEEYAFPEPGPDELLVGVEASGVAFADVILRLGFYPGHKPPVVPGYDVVGRVLAIGSRVTGFAIGQRVASMLVVGGYATHVLANRAWTVAAPESAPPEAVVASVLNYVTAYQMLVRKAQTERGDAIVVHGAGGGVGTALLDLARERGVRAFGTASAGKHALVERLGGIPIDYRKQDFVAIARAAGGVQAVFDHVGGLHVLRSLAALRPSGVVVLYGAYEVFKNGRLSPLGAARAFAARIGLDPLGMLERGESLIGYGIGVERDARNDAFRADFNAVMSLLAAGRIAPVIDKVFALADAAAAHERLERAEGTGKIVLVPA